AVAPQRGVGLAGVLLAGVVAVVGVGAEQGDVADLGVALGEGLHEGGQLIHDALRQQRLLVLPEGFGLGAHRVGTGLTGQALRLGIGLGAHLHGAGIGLGDLRTSLRLPALIVGRGVGVLLAAVQVGVGAALDVRVQLRLLVLRLLLQ